MIGVGDSVGSFTIVAELGSGGMGRVLLARDERIGREVAIKTVRGARDLDPVARARLRREAKVLSRIEHPAVCRLYDLLEAGDELLLVLEHVDGETLAARLERGRPPLKESLRLAEQVAAALAAAHAVSIVHRDVKPDNVMVRPDGTVTVVDFGIARSEAEAADEAATVPGRQPTRLDSAALTVTGEMLGTPRWMSPEQARGEAATAASDMYAFGLLLHAMVSREPPYPRGLAPDDAWRKVMWGDVTPPRVPDPALRGLIRDLESLEPAQRPTAVDALARLRRILDRPRRRLVRGAAAAAAAALMIGGGVSLVGLYHARRSLAVARAAEAQAAAEAATAREVSDFLSNVFVVADPHFGGGGDVTAREILANGAARLERELADQPVLRARLMTVIGEVETRIGMYDEAEPLLDEALAVRRAELGPDHPELADGLIARANLWRERGAYDRAEPLYREAVEVRRRATGSRSADTARALNYLARNAWDLGRWPQAEQLYLESISLLESAPGTPATSLAHPLNNLALVYWNQARYDEAEPLLRRVLEIRRKAHGEVHPDVARSLNNLGNLLRDEQRYDEAEPLLAQARDQFEQLMGADHSLTLDTTNNLAILYARQGRFDDAAALYRRALAGYRRLFGESSRKVGEMHLNLGLLELRRERPAAALPDLEQAITILGDTLGSDHPTTAYPIAAAADALRDLGRYDEAESRYREALKIQERLLRPDHPDLVETLEGYAVLLDRTGRSSEAAEVRARIETP